MIDLTCLCGRVRLRTEQRPDHLNECNCALCRKSGARWANLDPAAVTIEGPTRRYRRDDKAEPNADLHFCDQCGATTHFALTESAVARFGNVMMGVNMRLADEQDLAGIELRYPDGRSWDGDGAFRYVREARIIGQDA